MRIMLCCADKCGASSPLAGCRVPLLAVSLTPAAAAQLDCEADCDGQLLIGVRVLVPQCEGGHADASVVSAHVSGNIT